MANTIEQIEHIETLLKAFSDELSDDSKQQEVILKAGEIFKIAGASLQLVEDAKFKVSLFTLKEMNKYKRWLMNKKS
ncbi:hypothetical protein [Leptospira kirschneri]|uniref:hypothetical protein n=1 Tax=Leptospira kirschneri TaxID=29507 RepID=UPI0004A2F9F2|nr:hypothetical protein [Leptospira kirschneri]